MYQRVTSWVKAAALTSSVLSGVLGDLLVVEWNTSLDTLMAITAVFICLGFILGLFIIRPVSHKLFLLHQQELLKTDPNLPLNEERPSYDSNKPIDSTWTFSLEVFQFQLKFLYHTLHSQVTIVLLTFWIFGNAVFSVSHPNFLLVSTVLILYFFFDFI